MNGSAAAEAARYASFYKKARGEAVAAAEARMLSGRLRHGSRILSIGCGPSAVEHNLRKQRPDLSITGLDASADMLRHAPADISVVQGRAEALPFDEGSFDGCLFITSLEFIADYEQALDEARRVLRPSGRLIICMLNPASSYFRERHERDDSYVSRHVKHVEHDGITAAVARQFTILQDGYRLGVDADGPFESTKPEQATLHVLEAVKDG